MVYVRASSAYICLGPEELNSHGLFSLTCSSQTPAEGASISIYAAASSELEGVGACYLYNSHRIQSSDSSYDSELQAELWKKSCELVGIRDSCTSYQSTA